MTATTASGEPGAVVFKGGQGMIGLRPMPGRERTRLNDEAPPGLRTASWDDRVQARRGFQAIARGYRLRNSPPRASPRRLAISPVFHESFVPGVSVHCAGFTCGIHWFCVILVGLRIVLGRGLTGAHPAATGNHGKYFPPSWQERRQHPADRGTSGNAIPLPRSATPAERRETRESLSPGSSSFSDSSS
jgi:hypothetical protein